MGRVYTIGDLHLGHKNMALYIADEQEESKKEAVYKAALKFIDWYYENENNNKG